MITAKVKEVLNIRPYEGQNGTTYYHKLEMDNGDIGSIGKKKENAFRPGDTLNYTIETTEHGNKFKEVQQNGFGNGNGFKKSFTPANNASFALSYSKDLMAKKLEKQSDMSADQIVNGTIWMADKFYAWLKEKEA